MFSRFCSRVFSRLKTRDQEWYLYSALDKKYGKGYWKAKATGIRRDIQLLGMKKTLVSHSGRAPDGLRTNWITHLYRLVEYDLEYNGNPVEIQSANKDLNELPRDAKLQENHHENTHKPQENHREIAIELLQENHRENAIEMQETHHENALEVQQSHHEDAVMMQDTHHHENSLKLVVNNNNGEIRRDIHLHGRFLTRRFPLGPMSLSFSRGYATVRVYSADENFVPDILKAVQSSLDRSGVKERLISVQTVGNQFSISHNGELLTDEEIGNLRMMWRSLKISQEIVDGHTILNVIVPCSSRRFLQVEAFEESIARMCLRYTVLTWDMERVVHPEVEDLKPSALNKGLVWLGKAIVVRGVLAFITEVWKYWFGDTAVVVKIVRFFSDAF